MEDNKDIEELIDTNSELQEDEIEVLDMPEVDLDMESVKDTYEKSIDTSEVLQVNIEEPVEELSDSIENDVIIKTPPVITNNPLDSEITNSEQEYQPVENQEGSLLNNSNEVNYNFPVENVYSDTTSNNIGSDNKAKVSSTNSKVSNKYVGYEFRIAVMIICSILFLGISIFFIFKVMNYNYNKLAVYNESSNISYQVCLTENSFYQDTCIEEGMEYISMITNQIPVTFNYVANYSKEIPYNYNYYISSVVKIYDKDNADRVLYKNEEVLVEKKQLEGVGSIIDFSLDLDIPYQKYNQYVTNYKNRYSLNSDASMEVVLYLEKDGNSTGVASISIPLSNQTFGITKNEISNQNLTVAFKEQKWNKTNITYVIVSGVSALIALIIIIRLFRLIYKGISKSSKYQRALRQILREYDRVIIGTKSTYMVPEGRRIIKVRNFNELLDVRDTLEKPIIYLKVNSVKSEFYVEDESRIYQYTMKEADFEGK